MIVGAPADVPDRADFRFRDEQQRIVLPLQAHPALILTVVFSGTLVQGLACPADPK